MNLGIDLDGTLIEDKNFFEWQLVDDVEHCLPELFEEGFKFHLITARESYYEDDTYDTISKIETELKVKFETITLTNGENKCKYAHELQCKFMIDNTHQILDDYLLYPSVTPILLSKKKHNVLTTFKNWIEIKNFLLDK